MMEAISMWLLPALTLVTAVLISIPLSRYMAWIMDGKYRAPRVLRWFEERLDSGPLDWKQYTAAILIFSTALFVYGFAVLAIQPIAPLNPDGKYGMLWPTTIFNTVTSFMTNTNLQHYSGDVHFSNFSQIFFCVLNQFVSAAIGLCALTGIIRLFRGEKKIGNFFVDMWRVLIYMFVPVCLLIGTLFIQSGMPMTLETTVQASTLEAGAMGTADDGQAKPQNIRVGPVAAMLAIKQVGTNGGGFYGANAAHPFENPNAWSNFVTMLAMMLFPMSLVLMYGRMLGKLRHSVVIYAVMGLMLVGMIGWGIYWDTLKPNPGLTAHAASESFALANAGAGGAQQVALPAVAGLPVDQHLGNLESHELRFGTSACPTFAALTTAFTTGAVDCAHDSLTPMAGLSPMFGMWLNCVYGGKGVGMINLLLFLIIGVFLAGQMVGRSPEYLGKKVGAREMKLAMLALLVHPILILMPTGIFAATDWGIKSESNPGAHGFSEIVYEFSSASANNGSGFEGLGDTWGFAANTAPAPESSPWDIAAGLVMLFSRYLPIVAPIALAAGLGAKKAAPFTVGTMRDDTFTFGGLLLGTILIIGALLFLPVAALGPLAEHLGPIPFGG
jgi:K+-transporting ATPase ATPase A chain